MEPVAQTRPKNNDTHPPVQRRTLIVWGTLVASMTLASGLLMLLEPRPIRQVGNLSLSAVEAAPSGIDVIFHTDPAPAPDRWQRIVIQHSGEPSGSARTIGQRHQALGYGGLQYHFVIGNGFDRQAEDGLIEVGPLWLNQGDSVYTDHAITICLVGNGDRLPPTEAQLRQLERLVTRLQQRLDVPPDRVFLHRDLAQTTSPGRYFPADRFESALVGR
jgi:hypothetical protein